MPPASCLQSVDTPKLACSVSLRLCRLSSPTMPDTLLPGALTPAEEGCQEAKHTALNSADPESYNKTLKRRLQKAVQNVCGQRPAQVVVGSQDFLHEITCKTLNSYGLLEPIIGDYICQMGMFMSDYHEHFTIDTDEELIIDHYCSDMEKVNKKTHQTTFIDLVNPYMRDGFIAFTSKYCALYKEILLKNPSLTDRQLDNCLSNWDKHMKNNTDLHMDMPAFNTDNEILQLKYHVQCMLSVKAVKKAHKEDFCLAKAARGKLVTSAIISTSLFYGSV
ncbi:hypothetical protein C8J57DRAFT_1254204 [Mycena rebaudengoi]|nr:hypothetical protein C8J57DRAFT_1254204 [Mycena rebaudengoi]